MRTACLWRRFRINFRSMATRVAHKVLIDMQTNECLPPAAKQTGVAVASTAAQGLDGRRDMPCSGAARSIDDAKIDGVITRTRLAFACDPSARKPSRRWLDDAALAPMVSIVRNCLLAICICLSSVGVAFSAQEAQRPLRLVSDEAYAPVSFFFGNTPRGFGVDLARAVSNRMGRSIDIALLPWVDAQIQVEHGHADFLGPLAITPQRREQYDFTEPFFQIEFVFLVREDSRSVDSISDLTGKRVGVTAAGYPRQRLGTESALSLVVVKDTEHALQLLQDGNIDAYAVDMWMGIYEMYLLGVRGVVVAGPPFETHAAALAVRKGDHVLLKELNEALASIIQRGEYQKILNRWQTPPIVVLSEQEKRTRLRMLLATLGLISATFAVRWIRTRRRQILALKESEQALRASEALFRSASESAYEAIITADAAGKIVKWNKGAECMFGYSKIEAVGQPLTLLIPQRFHESHSAGLNRIRKGGEPRRLGRITELTGQRKDGSEFPLEISLAKWQIPEGWFFTEVIRDITKRKQLELEREQFQTFFMLSHDMMCIAGHDGCFKKVNPAFSRVLGYSEQELLARPYFSLVVEEDAAKTHREFKLLERLEAARNFENRYQCKDGAIRRLSWSAFAAPSGELIFASARDITDHWRATDDLHKSQALLQSVIDAIPDWVFVKDRDHRYVLVNQSFATAIGEPREAIAGRYDTDFIPPHLLRGPANKGNRAIHDDDDAVFAGQSIHDPHDMTHFRAEELRVFDTTKLPLRDSAGRIYGVLGLRRDITERTQHEEEQKALENQLRQAQKMEVIGHLTGGIAHDFNNILAAMLGYTELAVMYSDIHQLPQLAAHLQEILQAGIRAKELVAQLLTFSHRREVTTEPIAIGPIVREVAKLMRSTMPSSIMIKTRIPKRLPEVMISPVQLHQVLMNLGVNARDAIAGKSTGSGAIQIGTEVVVIDDSRVCDSCHCSFADRYLMISLRDNGCGIPPENVLKIFDPFFSSKEVGRGSGLGLSVLHGIVHSANGHLEVISTLGEGAEFRIYLPPCDGAGGDLVIENEVAGKAGCSAAGSRSSSVHGKVMVVDDEPSIVRAVTMLLENMGCEVLGLGSASEALRIFQQNPGGVDMVITDQTMLNLTGAELARAMLALRPDLPIVLTTGYSTLVDQDMAEQIGIRRFLVKPWPATVLTDIVTECLGRGREN